MKTIYVTDLDGTLLGSGSRLSENTKRALEELYDRGVMISPATGRSHNSLDVLQEAPFRGPYVLLGGARILDAQKKQWLFERPYTAQQADYILQKLKRAGLTPFLYTQNAEDDQRIYYEQDADENVLAYVEVQRKKGDGRFRRVSRFAEKLQEKLFFITVRGDVPLLENLLQEFLQNGIYAYLYYGVQMRGVCFLECTPASKADGVRELKRITGAERIVAFGDNGNDIGLFEAADVRIAVENATDGLKQCADRIIGTNDADAVVRTIYEMEGLTWNF